MSAINAGSTFFAHRQRTVAVISAAVMGFAFYSVLFTLSMYYQQVRGPDGSSRWTVRGKSGCPITSTRPSATDESSTSPDPGTVRSGTQPADRFESDVIPLLDQLYSAAMRMTHSQAHAEDLIEETYLRAFVDFGSLARRKDLKVWLYRILISTCMNAHRKQHGQVDQAPGTTARKHSAGNRWVMVSGAW